MQIDWINRVKSRRNWNTENFSFDFFVFSLSRAAQRFMIFRPRS